MNEENQTIIKALDMFGRVPEQYELLNEIERLNNIINTFEEDLEREVNISEQESMVGNYRYTVIHSTLEKMLKYFRELKDSGNNG